MTTVPVPVGVSPPRRTIVQGLRELSESRQILGNMVRRDFAARHKNSFFGMTWSLVNPLMLVAIFSFVFWFLGAPVPEGRRYPFALFFFAGIGVWNLFSAALTGASGSIVAGGYLIKKVYFPRDILPLSQSISALITFGFEFAVLMVAAPLFGVYPSSTLLLVPLIVAETFLIAYSGGLLLSGLTVVFRDIEHFIGVALQVLFWGSGVIYDLSLVSNKSETVAQVMRFNPVVDLLISFRMVVLDHQVPGLFTLFYPALFGIVLFVFGSRSFNRRQGSFAELI